MAVKREELEAELQKVKIEYEQKIHEKVEMVKGEMVQ